MTNQLYGLGREGFLAGDIDWDADDIKAVLIDTGVYIVSINTHNDEADLSGIIAESPNFSTKTVTLGTADAADITFTAATGASVEAIVIFQDTGTPATSRLIAYIDSATNLPVTPNGGNITVSWDNGGDKIFTL